MERAGPYALTFAIELFAVSSMLMIGLRYGVLELLRPLRDLKGVAIALTTNFVAPPLIVASLLRVFPLGAPYETGMMVVALAAGGPLLIKLAMNARADTAFAASIMVLLLTGTMILMPLVLPRVLEGSSVSAWAIARPMALMLWLPLLIGLVLRPLAPRLAARSAPVLQRVMTVSLWAMFALAFLNHRSAVAELFGAGVLLSSALFIVSAFGLGYSIGGFDEREQVVLGFGAGLRNFAAALVVARLAFGEEPRVLMTAVVMWLLSLLLIPFSLFLGRRQRRRPHPEERRPPGEVAARAG